jgi:Flp pilus assembly protein TadB
VIATTLALLGAFLLLMSIAARRTSRQRPRSSRRSPRLDLPEPGLAVGRQASDHRSRSAPEFDDAGRSPDALGDRPHGRAPVDLERAVRRPRHRAARRRRRGASQRSRLLVLLISAGAAAAAVSLTVGTAQGFALAVAMGASVVAKQAISRRAASRLRAEQAAAAPAVIDLLSACLLAGLNPYRSLVRVAERSPGALRSELRRAAAELDLGRTPAAAIRAIGERTNLDELRAAAAALEAAERWGAPPAEALAARAEALRSRARLRAEAEAGRAAVRLAFPLVFCFLPAFVLLVVVPTMAGALRVLTP